MICSLSLGLSGAIYHDYPTREWAAEIKTIKQPAITPGAPGPPNNPTNPNATPPPANVPPGVDPLQPALELENVGDVVVPEVAEGGALGVDVVNEPQVEQAPQADAVAAEGWQQQKAQPHTEGHPAQVTHLHQGQVERTSLDQKLDGNPTATSFGQSYWNLTDLSGQLI